MLELLAPSALIDITDVSGERKGEIYINFNPEKVLNTLSGYCLGLGWFPDGRGGFKNVLEEPQGRGPAKSNKEFKASMHIPPHPL